MSGVAYIEGQIAELELHEERFGLGANGTRRLEGFRHDLQAALFQQRRDAAEAARTLGQSHEEYTAALNEAVGALAAYVTARETLASLTARLDAAKRASRRLNLDVPPPDSFGHRCVSDYEMRKLRDRASAVAGGSW